MPESSPDPWAAVEAQIAEIGRLAGEGDRYRLVRQRGAPALLDESLAIAREARRLYRRSPGDAEAVAAIVERLRFLAGRYTALVAAARTADDYVAAVAAWHTADGTTLARLVPEIFADVALADVGAFLYYAVPVMGDRNRPLDPAELAARVESLQREGLGTGEPGSGTASDEGLRAILLCASWSALDTPVALRMPATALPSPPFRLAGSEEVLVYCPRLAPPFELVLARTAPDQDRWPDVGIDYDEYRDALVRALAALGLDCTYLPP